MRYSGTTVLCLVGLLGFTGLAFAGDPGPASTLPPAPGIPSTQSDQTLSYLTKVRVRSFRFEGNTQFTDSELAQVVESYAGKELSVEQLEEARKALTFHYISHGYINSGAILPDQKIGSDGVVLFKIVEGRLSEVRITGNTWLHNWYLEGRVRKGMPDDAPLNINKLKDNLEVLRQDRKIKQINAQLQPGAEPGQSVLDLKVEENDPMHAALQLNNRHAPSIGAERFDLLLWSDNLTSLGDSINIDYGITKGGFDRMRMSELDNISVNYSIPVTYYDTSLFLNFSQSDDAIVQAPFDALDIKSRLDSYAGGIRQPILQSPGSELAVFAMAEWKENQTSISGVPFSFSKGAQDGLSQEFVVRIGQEYSFRDQDQALTLRSTFNIGVDAFDPTINGPGVPDSRFFAWAGQAQYIHRILDTNNQALARVSTQLSNDPLLNVEQSSIGGMDTVRGYRENRLVRDNSVVAAFELHFPLWIDAQGHTVLEVAPFYDMGDVWNVNHDDPAQFINSAGLGIIANWYQRANVQFYYGYPFQGFEDVKSDPQDIGIHFVVTIQAF